MDIIPPTSGPKASESPKKKKGRPPSNNEAAIAMDIIKAAEKKTNESDETKEALKQAEKIALEQKEKQAKLVELEKLQILEAQQKIKRKLRENLAKKEEEQKIKNNTKFLEKSIGKIKWKSINSGYKLQGFVEDKLIFEIERKQITFNLYIKDKFFLKEKKIKGYLGCSTNLQRLKDKSEKFI